MVKSHVGVKPITILAFKVLFGRDGDASTAESGREVPREFLRQQALRNREPDRTRDVPILPDA